MGDFPRGTTLVSCFKRLVYFLSTLDDALDDPLLSGAFV